MAEGILPTSSAAMILPPMNTSTNASAYFR